MKAVFPPFVCHRQAVLPSAPLRARRARRRCNCSYLPAGSLNPNTARVFYQYDPNGNLLWQQTVGGASTGFLEHETATHYYWLPNEHGDILIGFDQGINSYAVYTDHLNTPRLVTKIDNPQNPKALTDTSNDLPEGNYGEPQGISPLAIPVWQWSYSPFGADLANGYEAKPTTLANNFKPDLWAWVGLPETGGANPNQVAQETWRVQANLVVPPVLNLRYPGQYYDAEAGLVQNWWRTYEPRIGRYSSADPIGLNGGWNRFAYVEGDGVNLSDRMGLATYQCTRKLNNIPFRIGPLYHQYVCVGNSKNGYSCQGLGPTGSMFNSPGKLEPDTYKSEACEKVQDDNQCIETCVIKKFSSSAPNYSVDLSNGENCQSYAHSIVGTCEAICKARKK